jgi:hypothetical protein
MTATDDVRLRPVRQGDIAVLQTREGVLRGAGWRNGAWRDGVLYSLLRTDPVTASLGPDFGSGLGPRV